LKEDLKNLTFQLNQNKGKEKRDFVWCTLCKTKGHHKNECPTFAQYMAIGVPNPLPIGSPWCEIFKKHGNDLYHCPMMQKYKTVRKFSYCIFCKLVGRDDKDCRTMELMRKRNPYTYRVQEEMMKGQFSPHFIQVPPPYNNVQRQYNNVQPQYNPSQYNQVPQYSAPRGDRGGYKGGE
jgi:hypothetical protein